MSKIDYFLSIETLDTRRAIANQFFEVADIDFVERDGFKRIHFSNDESSGYLGGSIEFVSGKTVATYHETVLTGDRLTVWNEAEDGDGWSRDTFRIDQIDRYDVLGSPPDPRIFEFDPVRLNTFLSTSDMRNLVDRSDDDILFGGRARDYISGRMGDDFVSGEGGRDVVLGGQGDDTVRGGDDDDLVFGGKGDDVISGETADFLSIGDDTLTGGAGRDTFQYDFLNPGFDTILDFNRRDDILAFRAQTFGVTADFDLVVGLNPVASKAVDTFLFDPASHVLSWDADGSGEGSAVTIATLENVQKLTLADFEIV